MSDELPFPSGPDELQQCRQQVLDYMAYVARNWPPDRAKAEILLAADWLADANEAEEIPR